MEMKNAKYDETITIQKPRGGFIKKNTHAGGTVKIWLIFSDRNRVAVHFDINRARSDLSDVKSAAMFADIELFERLAGHPNSRDRNG